MRPFLQNEKVPDETLIREMSLAMSIENERTNKFTNANKKVLKIHSANISSMPVEKPTKVQPKQTKQDQVMAALNELEADVDALKKGAQSHERGASQSKTRKPGHKCKSCNETENEKCTHCFFCGSDDHFSYGCRRKLVQGNRQRLHQGGQDVVVDQPHTEQCHFCGKSGTFGIELLICASCHVAKYCSVSCQKEHWLQHQVYCKALNISSRSNEIHVGEAVAHLSPKERAKVVFLVGNKCIIDCNLNGMKTKVLWDTGSQVSVISRRFLKTNFMDLEIRNLADLLGVHTRLEVRAANDTPIPYSGFVELEFSFIGEQGISTIHVPFLVTENVLENPVIT